MSTEPSDQHEADHYEPGQHESDQHDSGQHDSDPVVHHVDQSGEQIENYWSEERRADAVPMPMPQPADPQRSQSDNDEGQIR